jgi:hypothetical protein
MINKRDLPIVIVWTVVIGGILIFSFINRGGR